ncbi:MAG: hypothetical protein Q8L24_00950 [bacterium]|nr:hypothetical protein [bacterium]
MSSDQDMLVSMIVAYFREHPREELNALEVLQKAQLSTQLGRTIEMNDLRQALDCLVDQALMRVRTSGGTRMYSWWIREVYL